MPAEKINHKGHLIQRKNLLLKAVFFRLITISIVIIKNTIQNYS